MSSQDPRQTALSLLDNEFISKGLTLPTPPPLYTAHPQQQPPQQQTLYADNYNYPGSAPPPYSISQTVPLPHTPFSQVVTMGSPYSVDLPPSRLTTYRPVRRNNCAACLYFFFIFFFFFFITRLIIALSINGE